MDALRQLDDKNKARVLRVYERLGVDGHTRYFDLRFGKWENVACPVCDRTKALGIILNLPDGRIVLNCTGDKCATETILKRVGLREFELQPSKKLRKGEVERKALTIPTSKRVVRIGSPLIAGGRYKLSRRLSPPSPNLLKIFILLVAQVHARKDREFAWFETTPAELWRTFGHKTPPTLGELRDFLMDCLAFVTAVETDGVIRGIRWFDDQCRVDLNERKAHLRLNDNCAPYLLDLTGGFSQIPATETFALQSSYSIMLYMLVVKYATAGWNQTEHFVSADDLLRALMVPSKSQAAKEWGVFERDILRPAVAEIRAKTNLLFEYRVKRVGGKKRGDVRGVEFHSVRKVDAKAIEKDSEPLFDLPARERTVDRVELHRRIREYDNPAPQPKGEVVIDAPGLDG